MRRSLTVRNRTTAVAAIVVAAALSIGAVGLVVLLRDRLVDGARTAAELRGQDVAALVETGELPDDLSFPGEEEGLTQVVDGDGRVVTATPDLVDEPPISDLRPAAGGTTWEVRHIEPEGEPERFVIVATTVATSDGPVTVLSSASLEDTEETVRTISIALVLGIPVLVALVALVTRALVGRALLPVERMRRQASEITAQDLHRRLVEPGTGDEIDHLAGTLNEMLGRLDAASTRQRRFVADASHELRSPLASARTALEVAVAHPDRVDATSAMTSALADQDRLERLVDDLLLLARATDDGARPVSRIELADVVEDEVTAAADARITVSARSRPANVLADHRILARVVRNLLDNARRHAHQEVRVTVAVTASGVQLIVEDDGAGIPVADRDRIFDRFTRLDEARDREAGGSGLGLAIARSAVEDLGGSIVVDVSALGGAAFVVLLPSADTGPVGGRVR